MRVFKHSKYFIYIRNYMDNSIVSEVYNQYDISSLTKEDIVLDLGCNIGSFTFRVAPIVKKVIGYEPEPNNYLLARFNNEVYDNVTIKNSAVVKSHKKKALLYSCRNPGAHSLYITGRSKSVEIDLIHFDTVLKEYPFTFIKMDIEGGEYELLYDTIFNKKIKQLIVEFHFNKKEWKEKYPIIIKQLESQNLVPSINTDINKKLWHKVIHFYRKEQI